MRLIFEARDIAGSHKVELNVRVDNWHDDKRNDADRRKGIIDAANGLLRSLNLDEIAEGGK